MVSYRKVCRDMHSGEWTQLVNARKTDADAADKGTFWGMFQIGGVNYGKCGCRSVEEFVERMSYSELEQLELSRCSYQQRHA